MRVERDQQALVLTVQPEPIPDPARGGQKRMMIGVTFYSAPKNLSLPQALVAGVKETYNVSATVFAYVGAMIKHQAPVSVAGPVGITQVLLQEARKGLANYLFISALIALQLAWLNLLPIPALDGSRIIFLVIEAVRRRPVDKRKEALVHLVGFALILALVLLVTYLDLLRIFSGKPIGS